MFHPSKMVSHWCSLNKIPLSSLFVELPSSINGSNCLADMGNKFLRFLFLSILGIDAQRTGYMCLYLCWWCACFEHPIILGPETYLGGWYIKQPCGNLQIHSGIKLFWLGRVDFGEGFAFNLADFWWCTQAHPHWLGCTQCIPHHPSGPFISSSQQTGHYSWVQHPLCLV